MDETAHTIRIERNVGIGAPVGRETPNIYIVEGSGLDSEYSIFMPSVFILPQVAGTEFIGISDLGRQRRQLRGGEQGCTGEL